MKTSIRLTFPKGCVPFLPSLLLPWLPSLCFGVFSCFRPEILECLVSESIFGLQGIWMGLMFIGFSVPPQKNGMSCTKGSAQKPITVLLHLGELLGVWVGVSLGVFTCCRTESFGMLGK